MHNGYSRSDTYASIIRLLPQPSFDRQSMMALNLEKQLLFVSLSQLQKLAFDEAADEDT